jgi:hypothetical protein
LIGNLRTAGYGSGILSVSTAIKTAHCVQETKTGGRFLKKVDAG